MFVFFSCCSSVSFPSPAVTMVPALILLLKQLLLHSCRTKRLLQKRPCLLLVVLLLLLLLLRFVYINTRLITSITQHCSHPCLSCHFIWCSCCCCCLMPAHCRDDLTSSKHYIHSPEDIECAISDFFRPLAG